MARRYVWPQASEGHCLGLTVPGLVGSISPHLGNLSFLRELLLQNNSFGDEIPPEIGRLPRLQILQLSNNLIGGQIPVNISRCANLIYINFSHNGLVGEVPVELGFMLKLAIVNIEANNLRGSSSPFMNLSSLRDLFLDRNYFDGSFPDGFDRLKNLQILALGVNRLSGVIPASLFNHSSVTSLMSLLTKFREVFPGTWESLFPILNYSALLETNIQDQFQFQYRIHLNSMNSNWIKTILLERFLI
ncbi:hypothetical protein ACSBR1_007829 [Camellia fascicularis]